MTALAEPGHTPIRVLLLARSAGDWWDALRAETAELEMALAGAIVQELAPLEETLAGRRQAFTEALGDYGKALTAMNWPCAAVERITWPDLSDNRFGSALRLQMTALAALLGDGTIGNGPAEEVILRHEARYWQRTARQYDLHLHSRTVRNVVAAAALCGAADLTEAVVLLAHVPGLQDQTEDARLRAARWLRDLYPVSMHPSGRVTRRGLLPYWASPEPDLLAEHLVASVVDAVPGFLPDLLEVTSDDQNHHALTVLSRAAATRTNLADSLAGLLSRLPRLAPATVAVMTQSEQPAPLLSALTRLVQHADLPVELLAAISEAIPKDTQALGRFAITIEHDLLAARERLAKENPEAHLHDLAISLTNMSMRLGQAGRKESLEVAQRAVDLNEHLARENPQAYLPNLAISLSNLAAGLGKAGRHEEALAMIQRAVATNERLAEESPEACMPALAGSLNNLATVLGEAGRGEEALAAAQRAVDCWEQLAEECPDAHLAGLAWSLSSLARSLDEAGRHQEAPRAAQRAVDLYERLADESPDAHLEDLAWSLDNLARRLGEAGRRDEAMAAARAGRRLLGAVG